MHFTPNKYVPVDIETFNKHLAYCKKNRFIFYREKETKEDTGIKAFIVEREIEIELTYKIGTKVQTFVARKDGEMATRANGLYAFTILNQYYKVPRIENNKRHSAAGYLYKNQYFEGKRYENCYGYDINSSYSYAMLQDMPDTSVQPRIMTKLKENEIGFDINYNVILEKGKSVQFAFPKIPSPFKRFVDVWFDRKKNAANKMEKAEAKMVLNASIGYLQRVNFFLRTTILWYANERIKSFIDKNTLYCNTDSIVSLVRRPDIEELLGTDIGQFKLEHYGSFAYKGFNYQWNFEIPAYRGIAKAWFKNDFDILKDEIPKCQNDYYFNKEENKIMKVAL